MAERKYERQPGTGEQRFQDPDYFQKVKGVGAYTGSEKHADEFEVVTRTPEEIAQSEKNRADFERAFRQE